MADANKWLSQRHVCRIRCRSSAQSEKNTHRRRSSWCSYQIKSEVEWQCQTACCELEWAKTVAIELWAWAEQNCEAVLYKVEPEQMVGYSTKVMWTEEWWVVLLPYPELRCDWEYASKGSLPCNCLCSVTNAALKSCGVQGRWAFKAGQGSGDRPHLLPLWHMRTSIANS